MKSDAVDLIARTMLYEGYLLYPYRPSALKNRQRFTFGVLYPKSYCTPGGSDRSRMQVECPLTGGTDTHMEVGVRFLQLCERPGNAAPVEGWQDAVERQVRFELGALGDLTPAGWRLEFGCPAVGGPEDDMVLRGEVRVRLRERRTGVYKLTVEVENLARLDAGATRDAALGLSLASAHAVITVAGGELVSMTDPPDAFRDIAASCVNDGVWPVLVGEEGSSDCMLAAPIILYDYPQVAPESAGDLCDGTEIDEILALRILTMTEDEKREARAGDDRARQILDRTDALEPEHWARLHGAVRGLRKVTKPAP